MKIFAVLFLGVASAKNLKGGAGLQIESLNQEEAVHLDLELEIDGKRELFPLLPGTKCPMGHTCRASTVGTSSDGMSPLM